MFTTETVLDDLGLQDTITFSKHGFDRHITAEDGLVGVLPVTAALANRAVTFIPAPLSAYRDRGVVSLYSKHILSAVRTTLLLDIFAYGTTTKL